MSKVPCGGFELDESLALNNGKLGLAPGAGGGGSQADWSVTDSADPAFIKNKPFYISVEFGEIVPAQSVTFVAQSGMNIASYPPIGTELKAGETYIVTWDGTDYSCIASGYSNSVYIGNMSIMGGMDEGDTGEPFLIAMSSSQSMTVATEAGTHTVGISGKTEVVHPIDGKYLPTFVVDATNLPAGTQEWGVLYNELNKAWNSGARILLDVDGKGGTVLPCVSWRNSEATFIYSSTPDLKVYCLIATPQDGGSFKKYTIAMTEAT